MRMILSRWYPAIKKKNKVLEKELNQTAQKANIAKSLIDEMEKKCKLIENQNKEKLTQISKERDDAKRKLVQKGEEFNDQIQGLKKDISTLSLRSKEFKDHASLLEKKIEEIEAKNAAEMEENKVLREENKKAKETIDGLEKELKTTNTKYENERTAFNKQKTQLIKAKDDSERMIEQLNSEINRLK